MIDWTYWGGLTDTTNPTKCRSSWEQLFDLFSKHLPYEKKEIAPGFGPYKLKAYPSDRKNANVESISMAVFDADQPGGLELTKKELERWGINYACYSTWSYPEKLAFRLVIPFDHALQPEAWEQVRLDMIKEFKIPAHPKQCGGLSHFYYLPSRKFGSEDETFGEKSKAFYRPLYDSKTLSRPKAKPPVNFFLPEEPESAEDLAPYREKIERRIKASPPDRAALLTKVISGAPLEEHGNRNNTATRVTGMLAWLFPDAPLSSLKRILEPSVNAMIEAGSKLTWPKVESMLVRAMEARARKEAELDELVKEWDQSLDPWLT